MKILSEKSTATEKTFEIQVERGDSISAIASALTGVAPSKTKHLWPKFRRVKNGRPQQIPDVNRIIAGERLSFTWKGASVGDELDDTAKLFHVSSDATTRALNDAELKTLAGDKDVADAMLERAIHVVSQFHRRSSARDLLNSVWSLNPGRRVETAKALGTISTVLQAAKRAAGKAEFRGSDDDPRRDSACAFAVQGKFIALRSLCYFLRVHQKAHRAAILVHELTHYASGLEDYEYYDIPSGEVSTDVSRGVQIVPSRALLNNADSFALFVYAANKKK